MDEAAKGPGALTRRELLETAALVGAGAALATGVGRSALAAEAPGAKAPAYRGEHPIQPLPFDPAKLKGLSQKLLLSHHDNNYAGAVKRLNQIQQQLGSLPADAPPYQTGSLKREELLAANSMLLHEHYFGNLGGKGPCEGVVAALLQEEYGSLEVWQRDFRRTALALGGGSGWVIVAYEPTSRTLHNWWGSDHMHQPVAGDPVLVLDMYEHAYAMDYGADAKSYIDVFFANVLWSEVNRRVDAARKRLAT
ncbi:MAG TPA: Fe-Mn family superoxide dismutase [Myxococcota bacterium]|nr:Fe-Mn family superoxide dismutase [Myxococcota bacterium]